jgi:hypothetical protein
MKTITLNVLSEQSNHAVVQMPGRQFPASVIQGDSLAILCAEAKAISSRLKELVCADDELLCLAQEHQEKLLGRLLHYQTVLAEHHAPLPYSNAAEPSDLVILIEEGDANAL